MCQHNTKCSSSAPRSWLPATSLPASIRGPRTLTAMRYIYMLTQWALPVSNMREAFELGEADLLH